MRWVFATRPSVVAMMLSSRRVLDLPRVNSQNFVTFELNIDHAARRHGLLGRFNHYADRSRVLEPARLEAGPKPNPVVRSEDQRRRSSMNYQARLPRPHA